jgi:hypothetical protein
VKKCAKRKPINDNNAGKMYAEPNAFVDVGAKPSALNQGTARYPPSSTSYPQEASRTNGLALVERVA